MVFIFWYVLQHSLVGFGLFAQNLFNGVPESVDRTVAVNDRELSGFERSKSRRVPLLVHVVQLLEILLGHGAFFFRPVSRFLPLVAHIHWAFQVDQVLVGEQFLLKIIPTFPFLSLSFEH